MNWTPTHEIALAKDGEVNFARLHWSSRGKMPDPTPELRLMLTRNIQAYLSHEPVWATFRRSRDQLRLAETVVTSVEAAAAEFVVERSALMTEQPDGWAAKIAACEAKNAEAVRLAKAELELAREAHATHEASAKTVLAKVTTQAIREIREAFATRKQELLNKLHDCASQTVGALVESVTKGGIVESFMPSHFHKELMAS